MLKKIKQKLLNTAIRFKAKECGQNLKVNHWSSVTENTILGDNVNFNGMTITGGVLSG